MEAGRIPNLISNIPHPDAISYNTCLLALQNQGRLRDAIFLFARMATCASVPPDVATYNTLLHMAVATDPVILNKQDICGSHFVHAVLQSMRRRNVSTTVTTETLVFRLLCRGTASDLRLVRERYTALLADTDANQLLDKMVCFQLVPCFSNSHFLLLTVFHNL